MARYDIVVVGSGIAGLSSAYRLADRGDVLVVDSDAVGQGTSSRASGLITSPLDYPDLPEWTQRSIASFRELDGTGVFEFDERPYIRPVNDPDYAEMTRGRDDAVLLDPETAMERYGHVLSSPGEEGVAVYDDVGICDVSAFLSTLERECEERGVEFRPDTAVTGIREAGGGVAGVHTEFGPVDADHVVVAAGSGTTALVDEHVTLPIRPFTWNAVYLDVDVDVSGWPAGGDRERRLYWRSMPSGHLLVGRENQTFSDDPEIDPEFERLVAEDLPEFFSYDDYEVVRWEKCPIADTTTPDGRAVIDAPDAAPEGIVVAAGFHGAGVMAGLAIGDAVRSLVTGEDAPVELEAFALDRFDDVGRDFEFATLWS
jgi:glycine/D-amino acid oxidase-like deaminating enzyme